MADGEINYREAGAGGSTSRRSVFFTTCLLLREIVRTLHLACGFVVEAQGAAGKLGGADHSRNLISGDEPSQRAGSTAARCVISPSLDYFSNTAGMSE